MIAWLQSFGDSFLYTLNSILQFFKGLVNGLMNLIKILPQIINSVTQGIGYLPPILVTFATLTIAICVIYLIVGRSTGDS